MDIFNKNGKSKNYKKTMLDDNGMEYEVEEKHEIFNIDEDAKRFTLKQLIEKVQDQILFGKIV